LPVGQAEHRAQRERRQDGERQIPGLPTSGRARLGRPRRNRLVGKLNRQTAALAQAGVVSRPAAEQRSQRVRHPVPLARDVVTAVLVQLERQNGHPELRRPIPYVTQRLSTTA